MFSLKNLLKKEAPPAPPAQEERRYNPKNLPALRECATKILEAQGYDAKSPDGELVLDLTVGTITMNVAGGMYSEGIPHSSVEKITNFAASKTFAPQQQPNRPPL